MYTNSKSNILPRLKSRGNTELPMVNDVIIDLPHYLYSCVSKPGVRTISQFFDVSTHFLLIWNLYIVWLVQFISYLNVNQSKRKVRPPFSDEILYWIEWLHFRGPKRPIMPIVGPNITHFNASQSYEKLMTKWWENEKKILHAGSTFWYVFYCEDVYVWGEFLPNFSVDEIRQNFLPSF